MNDDAAAMPAIILVRPQMGENIGAAARAMLNFGLTHMRLVAPRDGWPNERAGATASGAGRVIDAAMLCDSTAAALTGLTHVYATTARDRELVKPVLTAEAAMADARMRTAAGERVGILFGPERTGLENEDIVRANTLVRIPVNPDFASLNLGQGVLILAYEWLRSGGVEAPATAALTDRPANAEERAHLIARLEERLDRAQFFWPEDRRASMLTVLRNMFSRFPLTETDIRTMHAVFRSLAERHPERRRGDD